MALLYRRSLALAAVKLAAAFDLVHVRRREFHGART